MRFIYWFGAVIIMLIAISFIDDWVKAIKRFLKSIEFKVFDMSEDDLMIFNQLMKGRNKMKCSICGREMLRILNISFECLNMDCKNFEVKFFLEFTDVADVDSNIEHFNPERKYCGLE